MALTSTSLPVADRVNGFTYAIRNIVAEAKKVEAAGRKVRVPEHRRPDSVRVSSRRRIWSRRSPKAMRDGHNGYTPSPGIAEAREAVAADFAGARRDRRSRIACCITSGTSEGIELALTALVDAGDEVLVPTPTYPLYTAVLAKIGARAAYYRTDPSRGWLPDLDHIATLVTPRTRALVVIDPNNPTGAVYPADVRRALDRDRRAARAAADLADEVYGDLAYDGPVPPLGCTRSRRADHFVLEPVEGVSRARAGAPAGWRSGRTPRLDGAARRRSRSWPTAGCAAPARCSTRSPPR